MRVGSGFFWFLYKIVVIITLVAYALAFWTPSPHWIAGFWMMAVPLLMLFHLGLLLLLLLISPRGILLPLVMVGLSCPFLPRTVQFDFLKNDPVAPVVLEPDNTLSVLNYNVFRFDMFNYQDRKDTTIIYPIRRWLSNQQADVLCFQEFYHYDHTPDLDFRGLLKKAGYRHQAFQINQHQGDSPYRTGLALFSKFPIVAVRDTLFSGQNGLLQADIAWRGDTVRLIDVHLYSMTLRLSAIVNKEELDVSKNEAKYSFRQLQKGFQRRSTQVELLESWVADSPHPVIVCGDFNETPYSYVYGRLRHQLDNAFEEKGSGFGFTYNHLPYFIRIDHQFYDKNKLELVDFETLNQIPYSDHYPLLGRYVRR